MDLSDAAEVRRGSFRDWHFSTFRARAAPWRDSREPFAQNALFLNIWIKQLSSTSPYSSKGNLPICFVVDITYRSVGLHGSASTETMLALHVSKKRVSKKHQSRASKEHNSLILPSADHDIQTILVRIMLHTNIRTAWHGIAAPTNRIPGTPLSCLKLVQKTSYGACHHFLALSTLPPPAAGAAFSFLVAAALPLATVPVPAAAAVAAVDLVTAAFLPAAVGALFFTTIVVAALSSDPVLPPLPLPLPPSATGSAGSPTRFFPRPALVAVGATTAPACRLVARLVARLGAAGLGAAVDF